MIRPSRPPLAAALLAVVLAMSLAACGGDDQQEAESTDPTTTPSAGDGAETLGADPTAYAEVPEGVELTAAGTSLEVGDTATLAWSPRQDLVAVVDLEIQSLERTTVKGSFAGYQLDDATRGSTPYFVRAEVTNVGGSDLSGRALPLYAVDSLGASVMATGVDDAFRPCQPGTLPAPFPSDARGEVCLLFFLSGKGELASVSFVPDGDLPPVEWSGDVERYDPRRKPAPTETPQSSGEVSP